MTEQECLAKMIAPTGYRAGKPYLGCVIQILVTSQCDKSCFHCTQASQIQHAPHQISLTNFDAALISLKGYTGVVGLFGGNPALHKEFAGLCELMRKHLPLEQRGIWCNNPLTLEKAQEMSRTFHPGHSNLNVHLDRKAYDLFKQGWPQCHPVGLTEDSRHSPPFVALRDVLRKECQTCFGMGIVPDNGGEGRTYDRDNKPCEDCLGSGTVYNEERAHELISQCDINQNWSAGVAEFRGQLRAWFCEIAMAQSLLHQKESDYPDTGLDPTMWYQYGTTKTFTDPNDVSTGAIRWWQLPMRAFVHQVRKHCHECGVPLRGYGELSQSPTGCEQTSETHARIYFPKRRDRPVQVVTDVMQLEVGRLKSGRVTGYLQNAREK